MVLHPVGNKLKRITHQKIRAILKKAGFKIGHVYSGRVVDRFSGGLSITNDWDDGVKVRHEDPTFRNTSTPEDEVAKIMECVEKVLSKDYHVEKEDHHTLLVRGEVE